MERRNLNWGLPSAAHGERCSAGVEIEWSARHDGQDSAHLPTSEDPIADTLLQPWLSLAERQFIDVALHEGVGSVAAKVHIVAAEICKWSAGDWINCSTSV